jgi:hypothetical protein
VGWRPGLLMAAITACTGARDPSDAPLLQDVGAAFGACNENEARFLAAKHDVRLAFEPCGHNEIGAFAWSPDGTRLYFQLVLSGWIMDADRPTRDLHPIPAPLPAGRPVWVGPRRLVLPLPPDGGPPRLAIYDAPDLPGATGVVRMVDVPGLHALHELHRDVDDTGVIAVAHAAADTPRTLHRLTLTDGAATPAFEGRLGPVDTFTWSPAHGLALVGRGQRVELRDVHTGEVREGWDHATRGLLSPDGQRVVLEGPGDPISLYFQRTWDELPPAARERELARARRVVEDLPAWAPREVQPPTIQLVDRATGARWTLTAFLGDQVAWYEAAPGWISFALWGFEGKQLKRNTALVDLTHRLPAPGVDAPAWGVEPFHPPAGAP